MTIQPFVRIEAVAAPLCEDNIDTDIIFPARFLLLTAREGLGDYAFHDRRFDDAGHERPEFVLNRPQWRNAAILVTGLNFGCGSSREQAVWALLGAGVRCIIAPSFGEIFENNCFRNGILPIVLDPAKTADLVAAAEAGERLRVDLEECRITLADGSSQKFSVDGERRKALLNGWDETAILLDQWGNTIVQFEGNQRIQQPWLYADQPEQTPRMELE